MSNQPGLITLGDRPHPPRGAGNLHGSSLINWLRPVTASLGSQARHHIPTGQEVSHSPHRLRSSAASSAGAVRKPGHRLASKAVPEPSTPARTSARPGARAEQRERAEAEAGTGGPRKRAVLGWVVRAMVDATSERRHQLLPHLHRSLSSSPRPPRRRLRPPGPARRHTRHPLWPMLLSTLLLTAGLAAASSFLHSDHHAPLSKRQASAALKDFATGLRRRSAFPASLNVTVAETPTWNRVRCGA